MSLGAAPKRARERCEDDDEDANCRDPEKSGERRSKQDEPRDCPTKEDEGEERTDHEVNSTSQATAFVVLFVQ